MAEASLDPIRTKLPLTMKKPDDFTFAMLIDASTVSDSEKVAILRWAELRVECFERHAEATKAIYGPPPLWKTAGRQRIGVLLAGLYQGRLTYGDYAREAQQVMVDGERLRQEAEHRERVLDAEQRRTDLQERALAASRVRNAMRDVGQSLQLPKSITCSSHTIGGITQTTCR